MIRLWKNTRDSWTSIWLHRNKPQRRRGQVRDKQSRKPVGSVRGICNMETGVYMVKISLNGIYQLKRLEYGADMGPVFSENFFPAGYLDARVPGDVRTVLREQGYIDGYSM